MTLLPDNNFLHRILTYSAIGFLALTLTLPLAADDKKLAGKEEDKKSDTDTGDESKKDDAEKAEADKPKEPAKIEISGVFEAINAHEISAETEQYASLKIKKIVPHGTRVTKGQTLVWFDAEGIDEKLVESDRAMKLAEIAFSEAELNNKSAEKTHAFDVAAANRSKKSAQQSYDNYRNVDRDRSRESAKRSLQSAQFSLENSEEELKQLTQMYEEDDLTEESEEIVLKRAKRAVDSAKYYYESAEISYKRQIEQSLPRREETTKETFDRAMLDYESSMKTLEFAKQKRAIEFAAEKKKIEKQRKELKELREDRQRLTIVSPANGIAFHGALTRGRLSAKPSLLKEDASVTKEQTLLTIVEPAKVRVRIDVTESQIADVIAGQRVVVIPTAYSDSKLKGVIASVSETPYAAGKYDCVVNVKLPAKSKVIPAMSCKVVVEKADSENDSADEKEAKKNANKKSKKDRRKNEKKDDKNNDEKGE